MRLRCFALAVALCATVSFQEGAHANGQGFAKPCVKKCEPGHFLTKACECQTCSDLTPGFFIQKHCDSTGNVKDHTFKKCSECRDGQYRTKKCSMYADTQCKRCSNCCPVVGQLGAGIGCNAYTTKCDVNGKNGKCGLPHDWEATVTTGANCGTRCGMPTGDQYLSANTTWAFIITDHQGRQVFQGLPNITNPATSLCKGKCVPKKLTQQPGISSGFAPKHVVITPALHVNLDSWCLESFCMHSRSAGVKMEFNPVGPFDKKANEAKAIWMNPLPTGPCGGQNNQWSLKLQGPTKGLCGE